MVGLGKGPGPVIASGKGIDIGSFGNGRINGGGKRQHIDDNGRVHVGRQRGYGAAAPFTSDVWMILCLYHGRNLANDGPRIHDGGPKGTAASAT